jgi:drug/metabolite transporter (DMT)-like permease
VGAVCFALASFLVEPATTRWTARLAGSIAYQGVLISGFNFVVNLALLRDYRPSALSAVFLTQPIFGVAAAALVAGDPLTPVLVLACVTVAAGIGLTYR